MLVKINIILLAWITMISCASATQNYLDVCLKMIKIQSSNEYKVDVKNNVVRKLTPQFFGFNINWFGFQRSYWNDRENKIVDSLTNLLKNDFYMAIYRYPGGSVANLFDWESSIGPYESRPKQKPVYWHEPLVTKFGFQEFLEFVSSAGGKSWIVNNLYGSYDKEHLAPTLADKAGKWAKYVNSHHYNIERWELGNELDRGKYRWSAEKYSERAKIVGNEIHLNNPNATLVAMLRDYNVDGKGSANKYNEELLAKLNSQEYEYALHQYYDGPTGGPSIPNRLVHICSTIDEVKKANDGIASIWITEHARWPHAKKPIDWKIEKQQTYSLQSAISVADYIIAVSSLPEIEGAFIHALSNENGPWTLFHKVTNSIRPSLVYRSLQLLRKNMLSEVLDVIIQSKNISNYFGGYDIRASVQTNLEHTKYNVWLINRSNREVTVILKIPELASRTTNAAMLSLFDTNLNKTNVDSELSPVSTKLNLVFNNIGEVKLNTPGQSVSTILIE